MIWCDEHRLTGRRGDLATRRVEDILTILIHHLEEKDLVFINFIDFLDKFRQLTTKIDWYKAILWYNDLNETYCVRNLCNSSAYLSNS
ncbi:hypothetical protein H1P_20015 [Hyella patelloides LEGE 07179]|uniref:Uncharacterized protein n=1 Tax=Hyella patelloides LEGE 07179 TaxID=945734 RepID=A0A563VPL3_9CYAN|nr:hypothetical protein H1P_20015 [Hyella patelloides LEGE 07179]